MLRDDSLHLGMARIRVTLPAEPPRARHQGTQILPMGKNLGLKERKLLIRLPPVAVDPLRVRPRIHQLTPPPLLRGQPDSEPVDQISGHVPNPQPPGLLIKQLGITQMIGEHLISRGYAER